MRELTRLVAQFFAGGPYRFLVFLLLALGLIGFGTYFDWTNVRHSPLGQQCCLFFGFFFYLFGACWYSYRIRRGTWRQFWERVLYGRDGD